MEIFKRYHENVLPFLGKQFLNYAVAYGQA
nr:MAG TPA: hypothetical protein [Caudoviricetes sp.]